MAVKKSAAPARAAAKAAKVEAPAASAVEVSTFEAPVEVPTPAATVTDVAPAASAAETEAPAAETLQKNVADVNNNVTASLTELAKTQVEVRSNVSAQVDKVVKSTEEFVAFGQGNVEAFLKSGQVLATGLQDLGKQFAATAQASYEEAVANAKALSGVKSVKEAFDLQSSFTKSSVEKALAEAGKLSDASVKLAEQVSAPLAARVTLAVEKFGKAA